MGKVCDNRHYLYVNMASWIDGSKAVGWDRGTKGDNMRLKYDPETFESEVEKYFKKITHSVPQYFYETAEREEDGEVITVLNRKGEPAMYKKPLLDEAGEQIILTEYIKPPSITAIQNFLGISAQTWSKYEKKKTYVEAITYARARVREYLESEIVTRKTQTNGLQFAINNFKNKSEMELGEKTLSTLEKSSKGLAEMSLAEKLELIESIKREKDIKEGEEDDS